MVRTALSARLRMFVLTTSYQAGANVRTELAVLQTKAIAVQLQEDRKVRT